MKLSPRPYRIYDWLLNSSQDHFGFHQGKKMRMRIEFEVPKCPILMLTLSTNYMHGPTSFAVGEAKEVFYPTPMAGPALVCRII
jgi:hypothetical protein